MWQLGSLWTFQDEFAILLNGLQDDEQEMNVNVSGRDLSQAAFVDQVHAVLGKHGVAANRLTLEITESVLMSHLESARDSHSRLRSTGVKIAIDDFGTAIHRWPT